MPRFNRPCLLSAFRCAAVAGLLLSWLYEPASISLSAQGRGLAERITSISPAAGRAGDQVTITGIGFGAQNVRVTVAGLPATLVKATGSSATFLVPGGVPPGIVTVVATNPGGRTGTIGFRVLEGVLLQGNPGGPARDALVDLRPTPAAAADVDAAGFILTRIDVRIVPDAAVGEINAALARVNGGIVAMQRGVMGIVIAVPRQGFAGELQRQAALLATLPGIRAASAGRQAAAKVLPFDATAVVPGSSGNQNVQMVHHLLPTRFPAAWNAAGSGQRLLSGCLPVPVVVQDFFGQVRTSGWFQEFPGFAAGSVASDGSGKTHGFDVLTTLGANFDAGPLTGANPFQQCLDIRRLSVSGLSFDATTLQLAAELRSLPAGKVAVNQSLGFLDDCRACAPADIPSTLSGGLQRAHHTLTWKEATYRSWNDFAISVAAGNDANDPLSSVYRAFGLARYNNAASISTTFDPFLEFAGRASLYAPPSTRPEFPSLAASPAELLTLESDVRAAGLDTLPREFNVIVVGSTGSGLDPRALTQSGFSEPGADLDGVGECVPFAVDPFACGSGTSFAAPQAAGLISYLWLLSPELRNNRSSSDTVDAIKANARPTPAGLFVLDAYAAVLSLDAAGALSPATAPIRVALLDADGNGSFTDGDLAMFVPRLAAAGLPAQPTLRDYNQFDLNGDGFTGGPGVDRFDLDRTGSVQFGPSLYNTVQFDIGGERVTIDETGATDLQILCYYAYSPLYAGAEDRRESLLANQCAPITVAVTPASVTLAPGATQQLAAAVRGTTDPRVTWLLPNGGGSITSTGLFTAGTTPGTYVARAISTVDPGAFADATITIGGGTASVLSGALSRQSRRDFAPGLSEDTRISVTLTVEPQAVQPGATPRFTVSAINGTGIFTAEATSGCNRPPEVRSGTAVSATLTISPDLLVATLSVRFTGTRTHTSCTNPTVVTTFTEGTLPDGTLTGTPVIVNGAIVAIDFNQSTTTPTVPPRVIVQTGRLEP